jgi:hypothetical protein
MRPVFLAFRGWWLQCFSPGGETRVQSHDLAHFGQGMNLSTILTTTDQSNSAKTADNVVIDPTAKPERMSRQCEGFDDVISSTSRVWVAPRGDEEWGDSSLSVNPHEGILVQNEVRQTALTHDYVTGKGHSLES